MTPQGVLLKSSQDKETIFTQHTSVLELLSQPLSFLTGGTGCIVYQRILLPPALSCFVNTRQACVLFQCQYVACI